MSLKYANIRLDHHSCGHLTVTTDISPQLQTYDRNLDQKYVYNTESQNLVTYTNKKNFITRAPGNFAMDFGKHLSYPLPWIFNRVHLCSRYKRLFQAFFSFVRVEWWLCLAKNTDSWWKKNWMAWLRLSPMQSFGSQGEAQRLLSPRTLINRLTLPNINKQAKLT